MRITADNGHTRQGGTLLRTHDVHNALAFVHEGKIAGRPELPDIRIERHDLLFRHRVGNAVVAFFPASGRGVMVSRCYDRRNAPGLAFRYA